MRLETDFNYSRFKAYLDFLKASGTSQSSIDRKLSSLNSFQNFLVKKGYLPRTKNLQPTKIIPKKVSFSFIFSKYFIFGSLIAIVLGLTYGLYTQTILKAKKDLAYSTAAIPIRPGRVLSFQGRLTDSSGNPITSPTDIVFKFYNNSIGGTELYSSSIGNSQSITPDENGIFSVVIGKSHGTEIPASVFTENAEVWLEITADNETMDPRQQIATVAYALNSETLQGLPPSASGLKDTVLVIDKNGNINLGETSPSIISNSGTMAVEGQALLLKASDSSGGNITINPDGNGTIRFITEGTSPSSGGFIDLSNANIAGGNLINAQINNDNQGYNFISFQNYNIGTTTLSTRFSIGASGNVYISNNLSMGSTTLSTNLNADLLDGYHYNNLPYDNYQYWQLQTNGSGTTNINGQSLVNFIGGTGISLSQTGSNITITSSGGIGTTYAAGVGLTLSSTNFFSLNLGSTNVWLAPQFFSTGIGVTGNSIFQNNLTIGATFISVGSTNLVTNLNANYLNSHPDTYFLDFGDTGAFIQSLSNGVGISISGTGIGRTITNTGVLSITGTANQIIASGSTGAVTLSLPQGIGLTSNVQFNNLTLGGTFVSVGSTNLVTNLNADLLDGYHYNNLPYESPLTFNNGLTRNVNTIGLGGTLTQNTRLNIGNTEVLYFQYPTGNVGVSTTNPQSKFEINKSGTITNSVGDAFLLLQNSSNSAYRWGQRVDTSGGLNFDSNWASADVTRLTILRNGFVGIGITSPSYTLDIGGSGTLRVGGTFVSVGSTNLTTNLNADLLDGYHYNNLPYESPLIFNNGLTRNINTIGLGGTLTQDTQIGTSSFNLSLGINTTSPTLYLSSTGNVGIGITNSSSYRLNVSGNTYINGTTTHTDRSVWNQQGNYLHIGYEDAVWKGYIGLNTYHNGTNWVQATTGYGGEGTAIWLGDAVGANISFNYNATGGGVGNTVTPQTRMFIQGTTGNVGIGTTNPTSKLHVVGNGNITGNLTIGATFVSVGSTNLVTNLNADLIDGLHSTSLLQVGYTGFFNTALNGLQKIGSTAVGLGGTLTQNTSIGTSSFTLNIGQGNTQALFIASNGNIGIGTTNPADKLQINGNISATNGGYYIYNLGTSGSIDSEYLRILPQSNTYFFQGIASGAGTGRDFQFYSTGAGYLMRIKASTGNVGIGTTSPSKKLDIVGDINLSGTIFVSSGGTGVGVTGTSGQVLASNGTGGLQWISAGGVGTTYAAGIGLTLSNTNIFSLNLGNTNVWLAPQYFSTGIGITGNLTLGGTFVSVGSTNLTTNLNADLLDGKHSTSYLQVGGTGYFNTTINGLTAISSTVIGLGGTLTQNTRLNIGNTEVLYFQYPTGNIGIGTTSPSKKLDVVGDINLSGTIFIGSGGTGIGSTGSINQVLASNGSGNLQWINTISSVTNGLSMVSGVAGLGGTLIQNTTIGTSSFSLSFNSSDDSPSLHINSNGFVGIGTTSPNNIFQVRDLISFNNTDYNTNLGYQAGNNLVSGATYNTFIGYNSGLSSGTSSTDTADYNTGVGAETLSLNESGSANTAFGYSSLGNNTTGNNNSAFGYQSLFSNIGASANVAIGYQAGYSALGDGNLFLGYQAGYNETGSNKLYISNNSTSPLIYGDFIAGRVGIGTVSPNYTLEVAGNARFNTISVGSTVLSDNLNADLIDGHHATDFIMGLTPGIGITIIGTGDTRTIAFDGTQIGNMTFGSGSTFTWTFNAGATTTYLNFNNGFIGIGTTSNPRTSLEVNGTIAAQKFVDLTSYDQFFLDLANSDYNSSSLALDRRGSIKWNAKYSSGWYTIDSGVASKIENRLNGILFSTSVGTTTANSGISSWRSNLFLSDSGYIGIGTTTPQSAIELAASTSTFSSVSGDITLDAASGSISLNSGKLINLFGIEASSGDKSKPSYSFSSDTNSGLYSGGNDILVLGTGGTARLTIGSSGYLGIGTDSPTGKFQINIGDTQVLFVNDTGYIGIGTTSPARKLTIDVGPNQDGIDIVSTNASELRLGTTSGSAFANMIYLNSDQSLRFGTSQSWDTLNIKNGKVGIGTTSPNGLLHIDVGNTNALFVGNNGYVGIGTTSASNTLVVGGDSLGAATNPNYTISIGNTTGDSLLQLGQNSSAKGFLKWIHNDTQSDAYLNIGTVSNNIALTGGSVGIGTTSPNRLLDIGTSIIHMIPMQGAGASTPTFSYDGDFAIGKIGTTATTSGRIWIRANGRTFRFQSASNVADYSEYFYQGNSVSEEGDIMVYNSQVNNPTTDTGAVKKSSIPYDSNIIGVVTNQERGTSYNNDNDLRHTDPSFTNVGLLGHVLTKVSTINGPISQGDFLTSSPIPGVAMKATQSGYIIGIATKDYKSSDPSQIGRIISYINPSWHDSDIFITESGQVAVNYNVSNSVLASLGYSDTKNELENGTYSLTDSAGKIITRIGQYAQLTAAKINAGFISAKSIIVDNLAAKKIATETIITGDITATTANITDLNVQKIGASEASFSTVYANQIINPEGNLNDVFAAKINNLREEIKTMIAESQNTATESALIAEASTWDTSVATNSADLTLDNLTLNNNLIIGAQLIVQGQTKLNSTNISNILTVGQIALQDNIIETTSDNLYIQPSGLGTIHLLNDRLVLNSNGNVVINGDVQVNGSLLANLLKAEEVDTINLNTEKINVATVSAIIAAGSTTASSTSSATIASNATVGTITLAAGQTEITIDNSRLTSSSMIYLTPTSSTQNQVPYIKSKNDNSFTIAIDQALNNNININWWLIN